MHIMIFDTETTSLDKPFCYNIGYVIADTESGETLLHRDYVVEQVWHNTMLFSTAYYADKRPLYVKAMRQHRTKMDKFGYICQQMIRDIKAYEVESAYAYNSSFDERVFDFNCEWFRVSNPFDTISVFDIRGYAHQYICDDNYCDWCEANDRLTESGNYSSTAETVYQYISTNMDFVEEHTALADSEIETEILFEALYKGAEIGTDYKAYRSLVRPQKKNVTVKLNNEIVYNTEVDTIKFMKKTNTLILKG